MYEIFVHLCNERGVTPYQVGKEANIDQATLARWKSGKITPRDKTLKKAADYFGVSLEYLKGETEDPYRDDVLTSAELSEYLEMLRSRSECRMLFSLARNATAEDVQRAVAVIEALRRVEGRD